MTPRYLSSDQVVRIHHELMLEERQQAILIAPEKLEAAVLRPQTSVFGEDAYPTLADKAAALFQSLAIGHPFVDGNKRIAFAAMDTFLRLNGMAVEVAEGTAYDFVISVTTGELREVEDIAAQLRSLFAPDLDER